VKVTVTGAVWAVFLLFSWTADSIVSGAVIKRIRSGSFWLLAVVIGSFTWIIDAAWGDILTVGWFANRSATMPMQPVLSMPSLADFLGAFYAFSGLVSVNLPPMARRATSSRIIHSG